MNKVYLSYNNIVSSFGFESESTIKNIAAGVTGLKSIQNKNILPEPYCSAVIDRELLQEKFSTLSSKGAYTPLEQMMLISLSKIIEASKLKITDRVGLIVSTTKGNIDVLEENNEFPKERAYLATLGNTIKDFFGIAREPIVLSNACVSGILAVSVAKRLIQQGTFDHVLVVGGDLVTKFILSGFNAFQALSNDPCKPYDKNRKGINIGEIAASVLVTKEKGILTKESVVVLGEGSCNDANHISGPSRTGEGLVRSVRSAIKEAGVMETDIDFISAHGTATPYNDEMEAIAFNRLGMSHVPLNSLKGYLGHTLGASGLLETIVGMHSLYQNTLFSSLGFSELGVSKPINILKNNKSIQAKTFLKTASGFGGCNTAAIFQKVEQE